LESDSPINIGGQTIDRFRNQAEQLGRIAQSRLIFDSDLPKTLKIIAEAAVIGLAGERSTIWIYNADLTVVRCVGHFCLPSISQCSCGHLTRDVFPNYFGGLDRSRVCAVTDTETDPRGEELREGRMTEPQIRAFIASTFSVREQKVGILRVDQLSAPKEWMREDQFFITSLADTIALAIEASERQRTEEALRASEQKLRLVLDTARDFAFLLLNSEGKFVECSPGGEDILGYKEWELAGLDTSAIFTPEDQATGEPQKELAGARDRGRTADERWHVRKDGSRFWGSGYMYGLTDQQGVLQGYAKIVRDITDRKLNEERTRQDNDRLEQRVNDRTHELKRATDQLEGFCYTIAHDLRAPLRSMKSFAAILAEDFASPLGPEGADYLRRIETSAARMDELINDLLEYSRVGRIQRTEETTDLSRVVEEALSDLAAEIRAYNAEVNVRHPMPFVIANKPTVLHVVTNLLTNALKFTRPGAKPEIRIYADRHGNVVRVVVQDNGIGIADEHRERIFQIFERLHDNATYPGTGVGLAIVKKAIERLGGTSGVESQPGEGSSFWFELNAAT
jgi:PAS domain S-box-containing protein